jgi:hypothetical protein
MDVERFDEDEPLTGSLGDLPAGTAEAWRRREALRRGVLQSTSTFIVRRRRQRRIALLAGLAVAYAGGLGTAWSWREAEPPVEQQVAARPATTAIAQPMTAPAPVPPAPATAARLELTEEVLSDPERLAVVLANAPTAERTELLRTAGDRYLTEFGDVPEALRCYRRYLTLASNDASAVDLNDTWLLRSLKQARAEETFHGTPQT